MGADIVTLHYTSMAAMPLQGMCHYFLLLVWLSAVLAIAFSLISLWPGFSFRSDSIDWKWRKAASALLMGAAVSCMHYTGCPNDG
jgi:NO-binding membrane sensor protein with MHYT domain